MSADNWAVCPKCKIVTIKEYDKRLKHAQDQYGVASSDQYRALIVEAEKPLVFVDTMREDYELGVDSNGEFCIVYSCHCSFCKFEFKFRHTEDALKGD